VFAIGAANRARGVIGSPVTRIVRLVYAHLHARPSFAISD
jgi:hypothetical protein